LRLRLDGETIEENALLFEIAQRLKLPIYGRGKVDKNGTWLWLRVPLKAASPTHTTIGNTRV